MDGWFAYAGLDSARVDGGGLEDTRLGFRSSDGSGGGDRRCRLGEPIRSGLGRSPAKGDIGGSCVDAGG